MTLTWDTGLVVVLSSGLFSYQNEEPDAVGALSVKCVRKRKAWVAIQRLIVTKAVVDRVISSTIERMSPRPQAKPIMTAQE